MTSKPDRSHSSVTLNPSPNLSQLKVSKYVILVNRSIVISIRSSVAQTHSSQLMELPLLYFVIGDFNTANLHLFKLIFV